MVYDKREIKEKKAHNATVSKIDLSKTWVYDVTPKDTSLKGAYVIEDNVYFLHDIIVPFINISSTEAAIANREIKKVLGDAVRAYTEGLNDGWTYVEECKYTKYIDNKVLSVNLWLGIGATDIVHPSYYTYNFDLETGKFLSYEDVYTLVGFNFDTVNQRVEQVIKEIMQEQLKGFEDYPSDSDKEGWVQPEGIHYFYKGTSFNTYYSESVDNYRNSVADNTINYFLDANKKLNVIVTLTSPSGSGEFDTIILAD